MQKAKKKIILTPDAQNISPIPITPITPSVNGFGVKKSYQVRNQDYFFEMNQEQQNLLKSQCYFSIYEFSNSAKQVFPHQVGFGIIQQKINSIPQRQDDHGWRIYPVDNDQRNQMINQQQQQVGFQIIMQERKVGNMIRIRDCGDKKYNHKFLFSLLFFVSHEVQDRHFLKSCDFSVVDNIYFGYNPQTDEYHFKIYFLEMYIKSIVKDNESQLSSKEEFLCNVIHQLFSPIPQRLQKLNTLSNIDTLLGNAHDNNVILNFYQWCQDPHQYRSQINNQLYSFHCENNIKKKLVLDQILRLQ